MQEQVGFIDLLEGGPKGRNQLRGQLLDEADGIREQDVLTPW